MKNKEIAKIFRNMAVLLEIKGDLIFKIRAYERAALTLENLDEDVENLYEQGNLDGLAGIGEKLKGKIIEYIKTGKIQSYEDKKKKIPVDVEELSKVAGIGPKTILKLYRRLKVKNMQELEDAAKKQKIRSIKGLGPVVEQNILKNIQFAKTSSERSLLGDAIAVSEKIKAELKKLKDVEKIEIAGSVRRRKETIRDIDVLVASKNHSKIIDAFTNLQGVQRILAKGQTKSSIRIEGIQADLRVVNENIFGAALLYFTGSQQHNIHLRKIAIKKSMKLSEYGIFDKETNKLLASKTEEECYRKLDLSYVEPEIREDTGEIEIAMKNNLPKLVEINDIKGDLQMHTKYSDGNNSILEMAQEAEKLGHEYILITDHLGKAGMGNAMDESKLHEQKKEIEETAKKVKIKILQGAEVNIQTDGSIDIGDKVLKDLDIVIGSIHFGFKKSKEINTKRLLKAIENENVDIIGHPTGRLLNERQGMELDFDEILDKAKATKTILEINALPKRLDLSDVHIKAAVKEGVKLSIGTDSHDSIMLKNHIFGVYTARRGWATKNDIINTRSLKDMLKMLKKRIL